uniref:Malonyl-CoA O-methyltransferase BioC n=1 Tax=Anthurium amnicola TaxID=1678845 RepID=A0A1D1YN79_9ARAE
MGVKATKITKHNNSSKFSLKRNHNNVYDQDTSSPRLHSFSNITTLANFETYSYVDGRKFHNTYILPSDYIEIKRSDYAHDIYKNRWNGNFSSPVEELLKSSEGGKVLDCGCGSGKWSYEMSIKYPNSTFLGLDMVPLFSRINNNENKPLNLGFLEYNICNGLPFQSATFNFIFQRSMTLSLTKSQWSIMLKEFSRTIKPGGWLELMELQINETYFTKTARKFQKALNTYLEANDHYPFHDFHIYSLLRSTNKFNSIRLIQKRISVGSWGGELGLKAADILVEIYEGMKPTIKQIMNVTDSEYDALIQKLNNEIKSPLNDYMYVTTVRVIAMRNGVPS